MSVQTVNTMTNPNPEYSRAKVTHFNSMPKTRSRYARMLDVKMNEPNGELEECPETAIPSPFPTLCSEKTTPEPLDNDNKETKMSLSSGADDCCCSSSGSNNKKSRKTSFLLNEQGKIVEEIFKYFYNAGDDHNDNDDNSYDNNIADDKDIWWTDDELDQLLTEAMLVADHFTRERKDWQDKMKILLKGCKQKVKTSDNNSVDPIPLLAADLDFVVDSEARGLELYIHPVFQRNRVKAIQGVLKLQTEYNAMEAKKGTQNQELRIKVLRNQSLKLTQAAKLLAKTLAEGDARCS